MIALVLASAAFAAAPDPKVPVALVGVVKGGGALDRGGTRSAVAAAGVLLPGDKLTAPEKGELTVVLLADGRRLQLKPGRTAAVGEAGFDPADAADEVDGPRPAPALLESLRTAYRGKAGGAGLGVLRGPPGGPAAGGVTPINGARVLTDHPALAWPAVPGAAKYRVQLFPGTEGAARPLWAAETREPRLPYPEDERVLGRGDKYRWRATAVLAGGKEQDGPEARFFVASDREAERLATARRLADGDDPIGWLLAADAYDAAGVYGRALPLYERLAARWPDAANYQVVLAAYYARAGRDADARKAAARAKELGANAGGD